MQATLPIRRLTVQRRLLQAGYLLVVLCVGWLMLQFYLQYRRQQWQADWMRRVEERGARAIIAGYGGGGAVARIPFLSRLSVKTQVELFLPSSRVARSVLELPQHTELGRIWIHKGKVDSDTEARIKLEWPGVPIQSYTPSPAFARQFKPEN